MFTAGLPLIFRIFHFLGNQNPFSSFLPGFQNSRQHFRGIAPQKGFILKQGGEALKDLSKENYYRTNPDFREYFLSLSPSVRKALLDSDGEISTLGELKQCAEHIAVQLRMNGAEE